MSHNKERRYAYECLSDPITDDTPSGEIQVCGGRYRIKIEGLGNCFDVETPSSEWPEKIVKALNVFQSINSLRDSIDKRIEKSKDSIKEGKTLRVLKRKPRMDIFLGERLGEHEILTLETIKWLLAEKLDKEYEQ